MNASTRPSISSGAQRTAVSTMKYSSKILAVCADLSNSAATRGPRAYDKGGPMPSMKKTATGVDLYSGLDLIESRLFRAPEIDIANSG
eukprot:1638349-Pleurochrysis_carterae.AAC.1